MPIDFNLYRNPNLGDLLDGRYELGDAPSGDSGGTPALNWFAAGGTGNGDTITIATDGSFPFGTRVNQQQVFYQVGDKAWGNGSPIDMSLEQNANDGDLLAASNAYYNLAMVAAKGAKAGRNGFAYESRLGGQKFGEPTSAGPKENPDPATTDKNIFYQVTKFNTDLTYTVTSSYSANAGIFIEGDLDAFTKGERVTVAKSGGGNASGNVVAVDSGSSIITFELDFGTSYNSSDNNGATVTGDVSGATATLSNNTYIRPDGTKLLRANSNNGNTPTSPDVAYNLIVTAAGQHAIDVTTQAGGRDDERPNANAQITTDYRARMWFCDASTASLTFSSFLGGNRFDYTFTNSAAYDFNNIGNQQAITDIGVEWPGGNNPYGHIRSRTNAVVLDYEYNCVILANDATFSNASEFSLCRNITWGNATSSVMLDYGEIPAGDNVYIFIMDETGVIINPSAGVLLGVAP